MVALRPSGVPLSSNTSLVVQSISNNWKMLTLYGTSPTCGGGIILKIYIKIV